MNPVLVSMRQNEFEPGSDRNAPGTMFFAAYVGPSMNPPLRGPELMEIVPYDNRPSRVGDVVFFLPPQRDQPIVHRIVRVTPEGISTLGDNNTREDAFLLQPMDIKGRVVAVSRGGKRREIAGGLRGQLTSRWLRWRRVVDRRVSRLLHPPYRALSHWGLIAWLLPASFRPRIVVFQTHGQDQIRLLLGQHVIGRYDHQQRQWEIQRPFRVFVDERVLHRQQDENRTRLPGWIEDSEP